MCVVGACMCGTATMPIAGEIFRGFISNVRLRKYQRPPEDSRVTLNRHSNCVAKLETIRYYTHPRVYVSHVRTTRLAISRERYRNFVGIIIPVHPVHDFFKMHFLLHFPRVIALSLSRDAPFALLLNYRLLYGGKI